MENFSVDGANAGHMWTKISAGSVDPLRFYGRLKFSVPLAVMVTKISKVRQNCLGTDIKNLSSAKLRLAAD